MAFWAFETFGEGGVRRLFFSVFKNNSRSPCINYYKNASSKTFVSAHFRNLSEAVMALRPWFPPMSSNCFFAHHDAVRALRLLWSRENAGFRVVDFVLKSYRFSAVRASRHCNNGLVAVRRRPRCNAARAPLQPRKALTAQPQQSRRCSTELPLFVSGYE